MSTEQPTNTKLDAGTGGSIEALLDALEREAVSTRAIIQDAWGKASYGRNPSWVKVSKIRELVAALLTRRDQLEPSELREKALKWRQCISNGEGVQADGWCREVMETLINVAATRRDAPQEQKAEDLARRDTTDG